jgi:pantoate--beta-alanine ligase
MRVMHVARTLPDLVAQCDALRRAHGALALVPTMGALHDGHRALVRAAVASGAGVAASIFVNPLQFGSADDLARYPRDADGDCAILKAEGCALVWMPDVATMYPAGDATVVDVAGPARGWEGDARPGHFRGVATVCARLFGQTRADLAFFGEKDWQQVQVVRRMVTDLCLTPRIVAVPTVREADGLAMSSRNRFLTPAERAQAPSLFAAMRDAADRITGGAPVAETLAAGRAALAAATFDVEYFDLVDPDSLAALADGGAGGRLIAAARLGSVRLLDNLAVSYASRG